MPEIAKPLSEELIEEYKSYMPQLAGTHAKGGLLDTCETDFDLHPYQHPDNNFAEAFHYKDRLPNRELLGYQRVLVPNNKELVEEAKTKCASLIAGLTNHRFEDHCNIMFVGDHETVDSLIHPQVVLGEANRQIHPATNRPEQRIIPVAKPLAWYTFASLYGLDVVQSYSAVATSAPATVGGVQVDSEVRQHINDSMFARVNEELDQGERELFMAYDGQTLRTVPNKLHLFDGHSIRLSFSASRRSTDIMQRKDCWIVPFATHQERTEDYSKIGPMTMAFGEPRQLKSDDKVHELGYEIAYMGYQISGITTLFCPDRETFKDAVKGREVKRLVEFGSILLDSARKFRAERNYYIIGPNQKS